MSGSNIGEIPYGGIGIAAGGCIRMYPIATSQLASINNVNYDPGAYPVGSSAYLSAVGQNVGLPGDLIPAWRVSIPDGNYAPAGSELEGFGILEDAINNAIALAVPGYLDQRDGFSQFHVLNLTNDELDAARLRPNRDICFLVNNADGKAMFAAPNIPVDGSGTFISNDGMIGWETDDSGERKFLATGGKGSKFENHGFALRWAVDIYGNLALENNLQLCLGWELGFRTGSYWCGGVPYTPGWESTNGFSFTNSNLSLENASQSTIGSATSEGIPLLTGPSYGFLSINDHQISTGATLVSGHLSRQLDQYIMARIPLSKDIISSHPMRPVELEGSMVSVNQVREYFGPVDITRLDIELQDEYGRPIDLNNMDWSFTIAFEKLYN